MLLWRRNYRCDLHKLSSSDNAGNANEPGLQCGFVTPWESVGVGQCLLSLNEHVDSAFVNRWRKRSRNLLELRLQCISAPLSGSWTQYKTLLRAKTWMNIQLLSDRRWCLDKKHRPRQLDLSAPCTNARNNCCVLIDSISHISVCWYIALLFPAGTLEALSLSSVLPNQELWGTISSPPARFLFWCKVESGPRVLTCHIHLTHKHTHTRTHAPAQYIPLWAQNIPWNIHFKYSHPISNICEMWPWTAKPVLSRWVYL